MLEFKSTAISYICPKCDKRIECSVSFILVTKGLCYTKGYWCKCGARHKLEYKVFLSRKGEVKIKVTQFLSDDKIYSKKRFRTGTILS